MEYPALHEKSRFARNDEGSFRAKREGPIRQCPIRVMKNSFDHPPTPFLARKGVEIISGGHPQTPVKGASPLCTPPFQQPAMGQCEK